MLRKVSSLLAGSLMIISSALGTTKGVFENCVYDFDHKSQIYSFHKHTLDPFEERDVLLNILNFSLNIDEGRYIDNNGLNVVSDPSQYPYNTIGCIFHLREFPNKIELKRVGTGILFGPDGSYLLTAAHCLPIGYCNENFSNVWIVAGIHENRIGSIHSAKDMQLHPTYEETENNNFDLGICKLRPHFSNAGFSFGISGKEKPENCTISGFPIMSVRKTCSVLMYTHNGSVDYHSSFPTLSYKVTTGRGQSGSPVYYCTPSDPKEGEQVQYIALGIHNRGSDRVVSVGPPGSGVYIGNARILNWILQMVKQFEGQDG